MILTTHVGSLPRPKALLDSMTAKVNRDQYEKQLRAAVAEWVRKQAETGIDILTDGELSKPGFFTHVRERLDGFEERPHQHSEKFAAEVAAFPEYYEQYFKQAMLGGSVVPPFRWSALAP